jgi:uncharacterized protein YbjT (DUF2867 family)
MGETVAVAGIGGALGREVGRALRARGVRVVGLARSPAKVVHGVADEVRACDALHPETLAGAFDGSTIAFSAVGASVMPTMGLGWRGFGHVDVVANRSLLDAAKAQGVRRFAYVSVAHVPAIRNVAYVAAHEAVVDAIEASGLEPCIVRPTGFFSALAAYVDMAAAGRPLPVFGDGSAKSNPIDDADLARAAVDAMLDGARALEVGGPDVLSRRDMVDLAFEAIGKPPKSVSVPAGVLDAIGAMTRVLHPRIGQALRFYASLAKTDVVVAKVGRRTLREAFQARAEQLRSR